MKLKEFTYNDRARKVFVMNEDGDHIGGLELTGMSPAQVSELEAATAAYEKALKPLMDQHYRNYLKAKCL